MVFGTAEFIIFLRSYSVFPVLNRSNFIFFFFTGTKKFLHPVGKENIVSKFQRLTRRFTGVLSAAYEMTSYALTSSYTLLRQQQTRLSDRLSLLFPEYVSQAFSVDGFSSEFFRVTSP